MMNIRRFKNWIKEIICWVKEAKLAILFCFVLLIAYIFCFRVSLSEFSIRATGYVLQFLGMFLTIWGLLKIRAHYKLPTLPTLSKEWLCRFPKWRKHRIIFASPGEYVISEMKARVECWVPDNPEDPPNKRIDGLVKNMEKVIKEQRSNSEQHDELQKNNKKHHEEQEQASVNRENQIKSDIKSLLTDDIVISLVGLLWLICGITMSTLSQELLKIMK